MTYCLIIICDPSLDKVIGYMVAFMTPFLWSFSVLVSVSVFGLLEALMLPLISMTFPH